MITPSEAVRLLLNERKVKATALAAALKVSVQQGSQLLSGVRTIQMAHVAAIAELLEVDPYQLFTHRDLLGHSSGPSSGLIGEDTARATDSEIRHLRAQITELQRELLRHLEEMFQMLHEFDKATSVQETGKRRTRPSRAGR